MLSRPTVREPARTGAAIAIAIVAFLATPVAAQSVPEVMN